MPKPVVQLNSGREEVQPVKLKKLAPLDTTPRCELCLHFYRYDIKKTRRGVPQSCHDLNCEPHDHCKLFQRLADGLTQRDLITVQKLDATSVFQLEALLLDRRKQLIKERARTIRGLARDGLKPWVYWRSDGKLHSARVKVLKKRGKDGKKRLLARVSSSIIYLQPIEGKTIPEKIKSLDVVEVVTNEEHKARKTQQVHEREPPTTRRPRAAKK
jgi:hypothetical protein